MSKTKIFLLFVIGIGILLRLYNLNWGSPFYFHPDERNIATSISQLHFPNKMNPHFFAYGTFPIYAVYFTNVLINIFLQVKSHISNDIFVVSFDWAIQIGRFYSALLSALLLVLLYKTAKLFNNQYTGILVLLLATFSVGFIQFAHFATFEMWLTFFSLSLFYWLVKYLKTSKERYFLLSCLTVGVLLSTKISSLVLSFLPILALMIVIKQKHHVRYTNILDIILFLGKQILLLIIISGAILLLISPFIVFDTAAFYSSIRYESSVALGTLPVFYTQEFFGTIPILFQFLHIYPFLLNPLLTIFFIPSFLYIIFRTFRTKSSAYILLTTCYILLFFSQVFLFTKWTRYMVPTLPFMYLIISIGISELVRLLEKKYQVLGIKYYVISIISIICSIFAMNYFITAFVQKDSRIAASQWLKDRISPNAKIVSEVYDLGILPFNALQNQITLYNFYDTELTEYQTTVHTVKTNNYVILPSQRIFKTRLSNASKFPKGHAFYASLLDGTFGFEKVYQTPCDLFCKITYLGSPIFSYEETASVFDRPTVFIFKNESRSMKQESRQ